MIAIIISIYLMFDCVVKSVIDVVNALFLCNTTIKMIIFDTTYKTTSVARQKALAFTEYRILTFCSYGFFFKPVECAKHIFQIRIEVITIL